MGIRKSTTKCALLVVCSLSSAISANAQPGLVSENLNPRSTPEGNTLFTNMPPEETGIAVVNSYDDPRMWSTRYQEMVFGTIGTGIAVADYDMDGRPDVFVAVKTGGSRLYRNLGDFRFQDTTESAGITHSAAGWTNKLKGLFGGDSSDESKPWDQGATFADIDNDGWLDLYVTCFDAPNRLYMNQGNGTFKEEAEKRGLNVHDGSGVAAFCDYDRDGWLDLYLQTNILDAIKGPEGRPDLLFRNNGDGTFSDVTEASGISGITAGHSATWWDYDEDGWPDLYVANDFSAPDRLYQNLKHGTFVDVLEKTVPHMPYYSMGADLGDVNNDNRIDFFVGDMATTSHEKDQRGMAISRARELGKQANTQTPQRMRNVLYLNTGSEQMLEGAWMHDIARTDWTWSTRLEDLDNDGFLDLHVTNGMVREFHNADILNRVMGAVSRNSQRMVMYKSPVMKEHNLAFRNLGGEGFEPIAAAWGLDQEDVSFGAAFGDFDGDGDLDLMLANYDAPFTVLRNDSQTGNRAIFTLRGSQSNRYGIGARIEINTASGKQVRQLVSARGYLSSSEPMLHFGLGDDDTISNATVYWPSGHIQSFENLPANRRFSIEEPLTIAASSEAVRTDGNSLFRLVEVESQASAKMETKPILPDGTSFTFSQSETSRDLARRLKKLVPPFEIREIGPNKFTDAIEADIDGDGIPELIVSSEWGPIRCFKKVNDTQYEETSNALGFEKAGSGFWSCLATGDFNGDGKTDFAIGNLGLNTRYRASQERPALLYRGNFGGRGDFQTVEAYYEGDRLLPRSSRKELLTIIPPLERAFPSTDLFATKTLEEIIDPIALSKAERYEVNQLCSGILLSSEQGAYHFQSLPWIAQIAPVTDFAIADFDGNGTLDLVAAQNLDQVDPVVGRFHGGLGLILLGDGNGNFRPLSPLQSGISLPGAGWTLDAVDTDEDGKIDLTASKPNQPIRVFRNLSK